MRDRVRNDRKRSGIRSSRFSFGSVGVLSEANYTVTPLKVSLLQMYTFYPIPKKMELGVQPNSCSVRKIQRLREKTQRSAHNFITYRVFDEVEKMVMIMFSFVMGHVFSVARLLIFVGYYPSYESCFTQQPPHPLSLPYLQKKTMFIAL